MANIDTQTLRSIGYVSNIFWHFVTGEEYLKTLTRDIFDSGTKYLTLKPDPKKKKFHSRKVSLAASIENDDLLAMPGKAFQEEQNKIVDAEEKCAVCFADVPFQFLDIHIKRYPGIGLGFTRNDLINKAGEQIQPVRYLNRVTELILNWPSVAMRKGNSYVLDDFVKVPSEADTGAELPQRGESFDEIYLEREWRMLSDFRFRLKDIAILMVQSDVDYESLITTELGLELKNAGVPIIRIPHFFGS